MSLFPHLYGQAQLKNCLNAMMSNGTFRVFLLTGPKGIGKTAFGRAMAQTFLCHEPRDEGFCGVCHDCKLFQAQTHPDFIELTAQDGDKSIRVASVRQRIISDIGLFPQISKNKVYLIKADELNEEGQNALLKTLEEPPSFAYFILTASDSERLQKTVLSRMTIIPVPLMKDEDIINLVTKNLDISDSELRSVVRQAEGNPGQALLIAQDEVYDDLKQMAEILFFSIQNASQTDILTELYQTLDANKKDIDIILSIFQRLLGELLRLCIQPINKPQDQDQVHPKMIQMLQRLQVDTELNIERIQRASEAVTLASRAIKGNCGFEVTMCRMLLVIKKELSHA